MISIILLAAGSSSRMGQSKQLLAVGGEPLLLRSAKAALGSGAAHVVVVLGANTESHKKVIGNLPVTLVNNPDWEKGMGNSLKAGLKGILNRAPATRAVIVMVCDQPQLTHQNLVNLIHEYEMTKSLIVASSYSGTTGVPVLFDRSLFPELISMEDAEGAKKVLNRHSASIQAVNFPGGETDLDTWEDFQTFVQKNSTS